MATKGRKVQGTAVPANLFLACISGLAWAGGIAGCGGTAAPPFSAAYDSVPPDTLIAYIENSLEFDTMRAYGDDQRLMLGTCPAACTHGPRVRIEPETRSHRNQMSGLTSGPGRIIARMISSDTTQYPKFNLGSEDTVYWAVTQAAATSNPDSLESVSMFISIKGLRGLRSPAITKDTLAFIEQHSYGYYGKHARAYWIWNDNDEQAWGSCAKGACCR
jgi:hypothetical protein